MAKKFKAAAAAARPVYSTIIGARGPADTQEVHDTQEVQEVHNTQEVQEVSGTQGRRGKKLARINMAFSDENLDYLRVMAALNGQSMTGYVNRLIDADRQQKAGAYQTAKSLAEK